MEIGQASRRNMQLEAKDVACKTSHQPTVVKEPKFSTTVNEEL
jgi:hypothetical protein